jgi:Arc/MetJ-type ribon-helix-helix transcriptional regulator
LAAAGQHHLVYSGVVNRTQVYLSDEDLAMLDLVERATGASRSELIRRAIRNTFGARTKVDKLRALQASAGSWADRDFTGAEYVDAIRGDLNVRLRRLGLE